MQANRVPNPEEKWILVTTILASSMAFIDGSALNVALPALQKDMQATGAQLLWILNAYLLMLAALILVGGSLGDRLGRKKVFMAGISLFMMASLACGLAPNIYWMIAARIVQGIGGALMIPGSLAIITASVAPTRRGRAIGTWSAATTLVTVIGPVLGGVLADAGLWRGVFLINLPLGSIAILGLTFKVPDSRDESAPRSIDMLGALLAAVGLGGLTYGFISAPEAGFGDLSVIAALAIGVLALVGFVVVEARRDHPMMPLQLFRSRTFSGANLLTLFLYGGLSMGLFFFSIYLVQAQGYTKTDAGLAFLPFSFFLMTLSRWAGGLADRNGPRSFLILGPALAGLGLFWLGFGGLLTQTSNYWMAYFPGIAIFGIGMGFTVAPLTTAVMGSVATTFSGTASGINNAVSRTAGVLTIAVVGSVALFVFASALEQRTLPLGLTGSERSLLHGESQKLGNATVPAGIPAEKTAQVAASIQLALGDSYRIVMLICAGMAWISAAIAGLLIDPQPKPSRHDT